MNKYRLAGQLAELQIATGRSAICGWMVDEVAILVHSFDVVCSGWAYTNDYSYINFPYYNGVGVLRKNV